MPDQSLSRSAYRRRVAAILMTALVAPAVLAGRSADAATRHTQTRTLAPAATKTKAGEAPLDAEEQAAQVLDRLTFGPRPGEVSEVVRMGWEAWLERQLQPATIPDPVLDKRLALYPALQLAPRQLAVQYPDGQVIRRVAEGKLAMPSDPQLAGVYEVLVARYQRKQAEEKAAAAGASLAGSLAGTATQLSPQTPGQAQGPAPVAAAGAAANASSPDQARDAAQQHRKQEEKMQARQLAEQVLGYPKNQRMDAIFKLPVEQRLALASGIAEPEKGMLTGEMTPHERELFGMMAGGYAGSGVIANEMQQAKILRAVLSERQLQEVMTDFWFNHFNIDLGKSGDELNYAASYERDAIRAHALGKFRDLLLATAQHPAMLIYLDNWQSTGPDSQAARRPKPTPLAANKAQQRGLNENYGREVMELHTVGVDGGYTQADVTSLAMILTGWTVDQPNLGGDFAFEPRKHEPGVKTWMGQTFGAGFDQGGINEGVRALTALAASPKTAQRVSYELAQRFVADAPPPALITRMAAAYLASDGDISAVLRSMVHSPEFFARANYRNKVKMPLEYVASSLRATETDPANPGALANELKTMGEPLYRCLPPTGYAATADHWMNSSALVDRLNYSLQLTGSHFGGMHFDAPRLLAAGLLEQPATAGPVSASRIALERSQPVPSGEQEALSVMERLLVPGPVSEKTNAVIRQQLDAPPAPPNSDAQPSAHVLADPNEMLDKLAAMILGSPEFQVH